MSLICKVLFVTFHDISMIITILLWPWAFCFCITNIIKKLLLSKKHNHLWIFATKTFGVCWLLCAIQVTGIEPPSVIYTARSYNPGVAKPMPGGKKIPTEAFSCYFWAFLNCIFKSATLDIIVHNYKVWH